MSGFTEICCRFPQAGMPAVGRFRRDMVAIGAAAQRPAWTLKASSDKTQNVTGYRPVRQSQLPTSRGGVAPVFRLSDAALQNLRHGAIRFPQISSTMCGSTQT